MRSEVNDRFNSIDGRLSFIETELMRACSSSLLDVELHSFERATRNLDGPRILVAGWYGADNLGDELMLRSVLSYLPERALSRTAVLLWNNSMYERLGLDLRVHALHYPANAWEIEPIADSFDVLVWGGGAILDESQFNSDKGNFNTGNILVRLSETMLARNKRVYCLGLSSSTTFSSKDYIRHLSRIVEGASHFSLRDPYSVKALMSSGIDGHKLERCEDLVFSLREAEGLSPRHRDSEFTVGFVFLNSPELCSSYAGLVTETYKAAKEMHPDKTIRILFIPFLNEGKFDEIQNGNIASLVRESGIEAELASYTYSLEDSPIGECDVLISYKYHSALLSCCYGIPCLFVVRGDHSHYENKMSHLAELAHASDDLVTADSLLANPKRILSFIEKSSAPHVDRGVFCSAQTYLGQLCEQIAR